MMGRPEVEMWLRCRAFQRSRRVLVTWARRSGVDSVRMASVRLPRVIGAESGQEQKRLHLVDVGLPSVT
jgi:hypothetical protein